MRSNLLFLLLSLLLLNACTETRLVAHMAKKLPGVSSKSEGKFKIGNPYTIAGKRYVPQETYNFTETGIASWYGPQFHGKPTANGENFDMNELTAAHRTLQLPSLVRVTNLENGRSLIVRINDRGPFKRGRIIDLSKKGAELLGFKNKGTAKVKVQVLGEESKAIAAAAKRGEDTRGVEVAMNEDPQSSAQKLQALKTKPQEEETDTGAGGIMPVEQASLKTPSTIPGHIKNGNFLPDPVVQQVAVTPTSIFVQAGSFGSQDNAIRLAKSLQNIAITRVYPATVNGQQFFRVRLGPLINVEKADAVLNQLATSGHAQAIIIVD